jgi:hypothetical protein
MMARHLAFIIVALICGGFGHHAAKAETLLRHRASVSSFFAFLPMIGSLNGRFVHSTQLTHWFIALLLMGKNNSLYL